MTVSREVAEAVVRGDGPARASFWTSHWSPICRLCQRILGDSQLAEDLTADVLADFLFNEAARLKRPEAATAYVKLMASRRAFRIKRRHQRELSDDAASTLAETATAADPSDALVATSLRPRLTACLAKLTPKARQAILLQYGRSLTNTEVAGLLDVSKQYIGRLLTQTLAQLTRCLNSPTTTPHNTAPRPAHAHGHAHD